VQHIISCCINSMMMMMVVLIMMTEGESLADHEQRADDGGVALDGDKSSSPTEDAAAKDNIASTGSNDDLSSTPATDDILFV